MASLDMLLESLNKEEEETTNNKKTSRRVPDRTISGDTLDSIKNHRRSNFKAPPSPAIAGTASRRTSMSRRGARRPSRAGAAGTGMTQGGDGGALETYVESMNESQRSLNTEDKDPAEDTVDSRQLVAETLPRARKAHNNNNNNNNISNTSGRAIVEEDDDDGPNNKRDGRK
jgi:hypothetical protein